MTRDVPPHPSLLTPSSKGTAGVTVNPNGCSFWVKQKARWCKFKPVFLHDEQEQATCTVVTAAKDAPKKSDQLGSTPPRRFCHQHLYMFKTAATEGVEAAALQGLQLDTWIPCPLDPKHMVKQKDLDRHLQRCNARPKVKPIYYQHNMNLRDTQASRPDASTWSLQDEDYMHWLVDRLDQYMLLQGSSKRPVRIGFHAALEEKREMVQRDKHVVQQASLLHLMDQQGWLGLGHLYAEFGAGTGELSYYLAKAVHDDRTTGSTRNAPTADPSTEHDPAAATVLLIDRQHVRKKLENRINKHFAPAVHAQRITLDIKDLHLTRALQHVLETSTPSTTAAAPSVAAKGLVVYSKHLCGAATDLTLTALAQDLSMRSSGLRGILIALCCHHRCQHQAYVSPGYLLEHMGPLPESERAEEKVFHYLRHMSSWATSGTRSSRCGHPHDGGGACGEMARANGHEMDGKGRNRHDMDGLGMDKQGMDDGCAVGNAAGASAKDEHRAMGWDATRRAQIGRACRRLLDDGRIAFLTSAFPHMKAQVVSYATPETTLEHYALLLTQKT